MNSHADNFATDSTTLQPAMLVTSMCTGGVARSYGCVSLKGESVT